MNTATLAVAGARKTQSIVEACSTGSPSKRRLVLTYTLTGQRDLQRRLRAACDASAVPDVLGWYTFMLRHWVRPFLPLAYPGRRLAGLNFDGLPKTSKQGFVMATGAERYLDADSRAYKRFLSKLAVDVAKAARGSVIDRLQRMYDEIYIDEVQDMTGYDLDILEALLGSSCTVRLVGDIRQSVFDTNPQDPRHRKFRSLGMLDWFKQQQDAGRLKIEYSSETWRSVQQVATFSDTIFDPSLRFPATVSRQELKSGHDGVFALAPDHLEAYIDRFQPACLRQLVTTVTPEGISAANFGISKGLTHERVLIFPTKSMQAFITKGALLNAKAACGLYVAVTRAVYSVAFVMDRPERSKLAVWTP